MELHPIENRHVKEVYEVIGEHFHHTRKGYQWKCVTDFLGNIEPYQINLDVGCGNGRNCQGPNFIGCDISKSFLNICSKQNQEVCQASGTQLPFQNNCFENVISIAVLHHIANPERRKKFLSELIRVTQTGGMILISVWALEQPKNSRRKFEKQENLVPWVLQSKYSKTGKEEILHRYYYVYREKELELQISEFTNVTLISSYYEVGNWILVLQKN